MNEIQYQCGFEKCNFLCAQPSLTIFNSRNCSALSVHVNVRVFRYLDHDVILKNIAKIENIMQIYVTNTGFLVDWLKYIPAETTPLLSRIVKCMLIWSQDFFRQNWEAARVCPFWEKHIFFSFWEKNERFHKLTTCKHMSLIHYYLLFQVGIYLEAKNHCRIHAFSQILRNCYFRFGNNILQP